MIKPISYFANIYTLLFRKCHQNWVWQNCFAQSTDREIDRNIKCTEEVGKNVILISSWDNEYVSIDNDTRWNHIAVHSTHMHTHTHTYGQTTHAHMATAINRIPAENKHESFNIDPLKSERTMARGWTFQSQAFFK